MNNNVGPLLDPDTATRIRAGVVEAVTAVPGLMDRLDHDAGASLLLVAAAREGSAESERLLRQFVLAARKAGNTWDAIGHVLAVSRQAAQQRFAVSDEDVGAEARDNREPQRVVRGATLFNELEILEREGRQGWRLVGLGMLQLRFERSDQHWEHVRRIDQGSADRRAMMESGWQHVGSYLLWHYYARSLDSAKTFD